MSRLLDLTGMVFGELRVLKYAGARNNKATWECLCSCGITTIKRSKILRSGKELFCGKDHPTKICTECKVDKPKTEFHSTNKERGSINPRCKECIANWYEENKEKIKQSYNEDMLNPELKNKKYEINKISRRKNKKQQNEQKKEYSRRPEVMERKRQNHRIRKETDPEYNIKRRLRWRLRDSLKKAIKKGFKYESSLALLGCDMEFFKKYMEDKFYGGMTWENISEWHIDHIKPCSKFDLTKIEDQKICFHYSNLQPLSEKDNLEKSYLYEQPNQVDILTPQNSPLMVA